MDFEPSASRVIRNDITDLSAYAIKCRLVGTACNIAAGKLDTNQAAENGAYPFIRYMNPNSYTCKKKKQPFTQPRDWLLPMLMNGQVTVNPQ